MGVWQQKYISTFERGKKEIIAEWARNLMGITHQEIDDAIIYVRASPEWREKLKGFPPAIDDFMEILNLCRNSQALAISSNVNNYKDYLQKTETMIVSKKPDAHAAILKKERLLREIWSLLMAIENKTVRSEKFCCKCPEEKYAICFDSKMQRGFCLMHFDHDDICKMRLTY